MAPSEDGALQECLILLLAAFNTAPVGPPVHTLEAQLLDRQKEAVEDGLETQRAVQVQAYAAVASRADVDGADVLLSLRFLLCLIFVKSLFRQPVQT